MKNRPQKKLIMVVEDDKSIMDLVRFIMRKHDNWSFIPAGNGEEAVGQYEKNQDISLILMDIVLPGMDGISAAERIREQEKYAGKAPIPILAFSGRVDPKTKTQCRASGMNDFIEKPMSLERIEKAILQYLSEE